MNRLPVVFAGALALASFAPLAAEETTPSALAAPKFTEAQMLETWGWFLAQNTGIATLGFNAEEITSIAKGMIAASAGAPMPHDLVQIGPQIESFLRNRQAKAMNKLLEEGRKQTEAFFAELRKNPAVVQLESGLHYEILREGTGPKPRADQTVRVHYTGTLLSGEVFDSSVQRGQPAEFALSGVIPGWTEGMQQIGQGGKIRLYVPPHLGYGDEGTGGIPPASTLVFEVELLEVKGGGAPSGG